MPKKGGMGCESVSVIFWEEVLTKFSICGGNYSNSMRTFSLVYIVYMAYGSITCVKMTLIMWKWARFFILNQFTLNLNLVECKRKLERKRDITFVELFVEKKPRGKTAVEFPHSRCKTPLWYQCWEKRIPHCVILNIFIPALVTKSGARLKARPTFGDSCRDKSIPYSKRTIYI